MLKIQLKQCQKLLLTFCLFPGNFRQSKKTYNFENQQCGGSAAVNARTLYRQNGGDIVVIAVYKAFIWAPGNVQLSVKKHIIMVREYSFLGGCGY